MSIRLPCLILATAVLAACSQPEAPSVATADVSVAAEPAAAAPRFGNFGLDTGGMDSAVRAGDDFFAYVNGHWLRDTAIPADRSSVSSFSILAEQALADTRAIAEAAAADPGATGDEAKVGAWYAAFMDTDAIEAAGLAPLQPALDDIALIADRTGLARMLGQGLRTDVDLLNATDFHTPNLFGLWVAPDLHAPSTYIPYLVQGGLVMPDRDFYLEEGRMAELRRQYLDYMAKLFTLAGADASAARDKAGRVLALETAIARVHASQVDTNDVEKGANHWARADFDARAPGLDWFAFFDGARLGAQPQFMVWQPAAVTGISALVANEPLDAWRDWLAFHALDGAAPYLPSAFADAHFGFHGTALAGTPEQPARWKRAIDDLNAGLGFAVGKLYVARHFSAATKARLEAMIEDLRNAFARRIEALDWMSPETKERALAKLAGLKVAVGYPEKWPDYAALEVHRGEALGNARRASRFAYERELARLGQPIDRDAWFMLPQEVNALNVPVENRLIFPAAILAAPFFDPAADDAVNYGAIGAVIGHEISHSFDDTGALFDETGQLRNWWSPADFEHFRIAGEALARQFDGYEPFPGLHVNGTLTLGENIADLAGLATAFDAYRLRHPGAGEELAGFSPAQRLFLGWAQAWRGKMREPALRNSLLTNVHAPGMYRALTVRNLDPWYEAFAVGADQSLYLEPGARVRIW